jgi:hypothetical protein
MSTTTEPANLTAPPRWPPLRPRELLDAQRNLCRWWQGSDGQLVGDSYADADLARLVYRKLLPGVAGEDIVKTEAFGLASATPYWISPDMAELVGRAAETWPAKPLHPDRLPSRSGFAYFAHPLFPFWFSDQAASIRAVRWAEVSDQPSPIHRATLGILSTWYGHVDDGGDTLFASEAAAKPGLAAVYSGGFVLLSYSFWPYGSQAVPGRYIDRPAEILGVDDPEYSGFSSETGCANTGPDDPKAWNHERYLQCLWAMMGQTITRTVREHDRHAAKRARRAGLHAGADAGVQVVTLRREAPPLEASERPVSHGQVNWSCRWLVGADTGGHWHRYHTRNGVEDRWVGVYDKGPPDKPLRFSKRVYKFSR